MVNTIIKIMEKQKANCQFNDSGGIITQKRKINRFLFFPRIINNKVKWIKRVSIIQSLNPQIGDTNVNDVWWEWEDEAWDN